MRTTTSLACMVVLLVACDGGGGTDAGAGLDAATPGEDAGARDGGEADAGERDAGPAQDAAAPGDAGAAPGRLGDPCTESADCESGLCFPTAFGEARCTEACTTPGDCVAGWDCGPFRGAMACTCATSAERCDGLDDDCDGAIDEDDPSLIGCATGQLCTGGACSCPAERMCPDAMGVVSCVDIDRDPRNCGRCDNDCGTRGLCTGGVCCTPSAERCNGRDDDCDGAVDEDTAAECAASGGFCVGGSCSCPAERQCGAVCADLDRDPANCGACGTRCGAGEVCAAGACCASAGAPVDILFMVDNSNSMAEEQASLAASLPRFVRVLTTGDLDGDGRPDATPARDLQLGVITSDMGVGGFIVPTCNDPAFGDDGILRTQGRTDLPGCRATYPAILRFDPAGTVSPADFARDFACVATVGTGGCGFEQQLEASLKAVTPSTSATRFFRDTTGHGDGANAGFLRAGSIFVNVLLTDEEDCSSAMPAVFDPASTTYTADLNLRCFTYPETMHPLSRYVDGLLAVRREPRDLVYAPIVGIPVDLEGASYAAMLADPRMTERVDPSFPHRLAASCDVPGRGTAFPPRRIVRAAEALERRGASTVVGSICQESYDGTVTAILSRVLARLGALCM
ncbi:MAG: hypothetical protein KF729_25840 [Sandaracinaceae bacterium]|nr:hypothetical protein [Sandaracinaceae bacterium]